MTDIRLGPWGPFPFVDLVLLVWFALTAASVAYVAWDAWRNNPELTVMKWGWLLVTAYTGPVGLTLYVLSCKEPFPARWTARPRSRRTQSHQGPPSPTSSRSSRRGLSSTTRTTTPTASRRSGCTAP